MELRLPATLPRLLLPWYRKNARDLPWRRTNDPYSIWLSEIMLQQTRVEAVKEYYRRFLETLPSVEALAKAEKERLLKLWEGLGYYNRVRNMQKAAQCVMKNHDGVFPDTYDEILALPGIGPYTAGAIASIAFGLPTPAVDGNVMRVIARLTELDEVVDSLAARRKIEKALVPLYPKEGSGDFTQSLMELGATVCLPGGAPLCGACPLAEICLANKNGTTEDYPLRSIKRPRRMEEHTVLLLRSDGGEIGLRQRDHDTLLGSLWELPNLPGTLKKEEIWEETKKMGLEPARIGKQGVRKHLFTHIEWRMTCWNVFCGQRACQFTWATEEELEEKYAMPAAFKICLK